MEKARHMFPGGNTCRGFHSFYDYMAHYSNRKKIILKGGPGVGKSTLMKHLGEKFSDEGLNIEYHWCSSDNNSVDGLVVGTKQKICLVDGTFPHTVDPVYPAAFDEILNMGEFWDEKVLWANKANIIELTDRISTCFQRAYLRLQESWLAYQEWKSYYDKTVDTAAVNHNISALANEFLLNSKKSGQSPRHLFAAAITPEGIVNKADTLIDNEYKLFVVKGSPGSGMKKIFKHIVELSYLEGIYAEVYHCPFDPEDIDMIILPDSKTVIIDISGYIVNYENNLPSKKYKRLLDFNIFINSSLIDPEAKHIAQARQRFEASIKGAVEHIQKAKKHHDHLEEYYIPAMNFKKINNMEDELFEKLKTIVS